MNYLARYEAALDERMGSEANDRYRVVRLVRDRAKRREIVNAHLTEPNYWRLMGWLSAAPQNGINFASTQEAVVFLRRQLNRIRNAKARNHWSAPEWSVLLPAYRDRLIVARYFARFGAQLWAREAA